MTTGPYTLPLYVYCEYQVFTPFTKKNIITAARKTRHIGEGWNPVKTKVTPVISAN